MEYMKPSIEVIELVTEAVTDFGDKSNTYFD